MLQLIAYVLTLILWTGNPNHRERRDIFDFIGDWGIYQAALWGGSTYGPSREEGNSSASRYRWGRSLKLLGSFRVWTSDWLTLNYLSAAVVRRADEFLFLEGKSLSKIFEYSFLNMNIRSHHMDILWSTCEKIKTQSWDVKFEWTNTSGPVCWESTEWREWSWRSWDCDEWGWNHGCTCGGRWVN